MDFIVELVRRMLLELPKQAAEQQASSTGAPAGPTFRPSTRLALLLLQALSRCAAASAAVFVAAASATASATRPAAAVVALAPGTRWLLVQLVVVCMCGAFRSSVSGWSAAGAAAVVSEQQRLVRDAVLAAVSRLLVAVPEALEWVLDQGAAAFDASSSSGTVAGDGRTGGAEESWWFAHDELPALLEGLRVLMVAEAGRKHFARGDAPARMRRLLDVARAAATSSSSTTSCASGGGGDSAELHGAVARLTSECEMLFGDEALFDDNMDGDKL
jgi:hypothetical protein